MTTASRSGASARIAVVIPCYEHGELAREAVASIREDEPVDIVVVDDASPSAATRTALDELETAGVQVIRRPRNQGHAASRNAGLRTCRAPYVFTLDADDLAMPGALCALADRLDGDPSIAACYGDFVHCGQRDDVVRLPPRLDPFVIAHVNRHPCTAMFRRSVLEQAGGWPEIEGYEDWGLWMTLAQDGHDVVHVGEPMLMFAYRIGHGQMLAVSRARHRALYRELRRRHPRLFDELPDHRARSSLSAPFRVLVPLLYGERLRSTRDTPFKRRVARALGTRLGLMLKTRRSDQRLSR